MFRDIETLVLSHNLIIMNNSQKTRASRNRGMNIILILLVVVLGIYAYLFFGFNEDAALTSSKAQLTSCATTNKYSRLLQCTRWNKLNQVNIINPWDTTKVLQKYLFVPKNVREANEKKVSDWKHIFHGKVIYTPVERAVIYSSVHCALVVDLGCVHNIVGVTDAEYIYSPAVRQGLDDGQIADLGSGLDPNIEKLITLKPEVLLISPFEYSGGHGRVDKIGIPVIECADYMEVSPLARAEWMKFYGMMFGKSDVATSLFINSERAYLDIAHRASSASKRPTVLAETKSSSAWYVPGGRSYVAGYFKDAGADYLWADDNRSGSVPVSFETVFKKAKDADFWLFKYNKDKDMTLDDLKAEYAPYAGFRPYHIKQVYGCNTRYKRYYEDIPFHPERLLANMAHIFHPEIFESSEYTYFSPLP